jgi:hypothetical protein
MLLLCLGALYTIIHEGISREKLRRIPSIERLIWAGDMQSGSDKSALQFVPENSLPRRDYRDTSFQFRYMNSSKHSLCTKSLPSQCPRQAQPGRRLSLFLCTFRARKRPALTRCLLSSSTVHVHRHEHITSCTATSHFRESEHSHLLLFNPVISTRVRCLSTPHPFRLRSLSYATLHPLPSHPQHSPSVKQHLHTPPYQIPSTPGSPTKCRSHPHIHHPNRLRPCPHHGHHTLRAPAQ